MKREMLDLAKLKAILAARGFRVVLNPDGSCALRGSREQATPALMRVVAYYRDEFIKELRSLKS